MLQWRRDARSIHRALELPDRGGMGRGREMEGGEKEGERKEGREEKEGGKGFSDILAILFIIHAKSPALLCLGHVTGSWV